MCRVIIHHTVHDTEKSQIKNGLLSIFPVNNNLSAPPPRPRERASERPSRRRQVRHAPQPGYHDRAVCAGAGARRSPPPSVRAANHHIHIRRKIELFEPDRGDTHPPLPPSFPRCSRRRPPRRRAMNRARLVARRRAPADTPGELQHQEGCGASGGGGGSGLRRPAPSEAEQKPQARRVDERVGEGGRSPARVSLLLLLLPARRAYATGNATAPAAGDPNSHNWRPKGEGVVVR